MDALAYWTIAGVVFTAAAFYLGLHAKFIDLFTAKRLKEKNFSHKKVKELEPSDFLGVRANPSKGFKEYYLNRKVDKIFKDRFRVGHHILVIGKPLSGKSRLIYHNLKSYDPNSEVYIIENESFDASEAHKLYFKPGSSKEPNFLVINDIDKLLKNDSGNLAEGFLLSKAKSKGIRLIATCRSSEIDFLNGKEVGDIFSRIEISDLKEQDKVKLRLVSPLNDISRFDDTIGSFFFSDNEKEKIYRKWSSEKLLEAEFLRAYKFIEFYRRKNRGNIKVIQNYVEVRCRIKLSHRDLENILKRLKESGFIKLLDNEFFEIDPAVLRTAIEPEVNEEIVFHEALQLFPKDYKIYNRLIGRASDYDLSRKVFEKLQSTFKKKNYNKDAYLYNNLILSSRNYEEACKWYEAMINLSLPVEDYTFNNLIKHASHSEARVRLYEMQSAGIKPNHMTLNHFISKPKDLIEAISVMEEFHNVHKPVESTFFILQMKIKSIEDGWLVLKEMDQYGIQPSVFFFYNISKYAKTFSKRYSIYERAVDYGIEDELNEEFFSRMLFCIKNGGVDQKKALEIFEFSMAKMFLLDSQAIGSLIGCLDYTKGLNVFHRALDSGQPIHISWFNNLIKQSGSFSIAEHLFMQIEEYDGLSPTAFTYNSWIHACEGIEEATQVFDQMIEKKIRLGTDTYYELIALCDSFDDAIIYYQKLLDSPGLDVKPPVINKLLDHVTTYEDFSYMVDQIGEHSVFDEKTAFQFRKKIKMIGVGDLEAFTKQLKNLEFFTDDKVIGGLLGQFDKFDDAWEIYLLARSEISSLSSRTLNQLLYLTRFISDEDKKYEAAEMVLKEFINQKLSTDNLTKKNLHSITLIKHKGFREALDAYKHLFKPYVALDLSIFHLLVGRIKNYNYFLTVYQEMQSVGLLPNSLFYDSWISKITRGKKTVDKMNTGNSVNRYLMNQSLNPSTYFINQIIYLNDSVPNLRRIIEGYRKVNAPIRSTHLNYILLNKRKLKQNDIWWFYFQFYNSNVELERNTFDILMRKVKNRRKVMLRYREYLKKQSFNIQSYQEEKILSEED